MPTSEEVVVSLRLATLTEHVAPRANSILVLGLVSGAISRLPNVLHVVSVLHLLATTPRFMLLETWKTLAEVRCTHRRPVSTTLVMRLREVEEATPTLPPQESMVVLLVTPSRFLVSHIVLSIPSIVVSPVLLRVIAPEIVVRYTGQASS